MGRAPCHANVKDVLVRPSTTVPPRISVYAKAADGTIVRTCDAGYGRLGVLAGHGRLGVLAGHGRLRALVGHGRPGVLAGYSRLGGALVGNGRLGVPPC